MKRENYSGPLSDIWVIHYIFQYIPFKNPRDPYFILSGRSSTSLDDLLLLLRRDAQKGSDQQILKQDKSQKVEQKVEEILSLAEKPPREKPLSPCHTRNWKQPAASADARDIAAAISDKINAHFTQVLFREWIGLALHQEDPVALVDLLDTTIYIKNCISWYIHRAPGQKGKYELVEKVWSEYLRSIVLILITLLGVDQTKLESLGSLGCFSPSSSFHLSRRSSRCSGTRLGSDQVNVCSEAANPRFSRRAGRSGNPFRKGISPGRES